MSFIIISHKIELFVQLSRYLFFYKASVFSPFSLVLGAILQIKTFFSLKRLI